MSGAYPDTSAEANATAEAQVVAGLASTAARVAESQSQAANFINAHGEAVNEGHSQVGVVPPA